MHTQFDITAVKADQNGNVVIIDWIFTATEGVETSIGAGSAILDSSSTLPAALGNTKEDLVAKLVEHHGGQAFVDGLTQIHAKNINLLKLKRTATPVNYSFLVPNAQAATQSTVAVLEPVNLP
jgi:hypothetical protein